MISRNDFGQIKQEVQMSIIEGLDYAKKYSAHNYILYLADCELVKRYKNNHLKRSPYVIGYAGDIYKDEPRVSLLISFLNHFYSFPGNLSKTDDDEFRLHLELMVYTHIWESKPFLKQLFRLGAIVNNESYPWSVNVDATKRDDFIGRKIRDKFFQKKLALGNIISNAYHSQLRNAFAHSEYVFDKKIRLIHLDNYKDGKPGQIKDTGFDEWTIRFVYSALLSYHLISERNDRRRSVIKDFGTNTFNIEHPISDTEFENITIQYEQEDDFFTCLQ